MTTAATPLASDAAVRRRDWQIILLIGVAHASSHFFQLVLPSLYVSLGNEFGLDFARLGLLVSTFYVVSGIGQASSGFVVDRIGARPVLWFGLACFVLSGLLIGSATGYPMLMTAAVVGGIGNSVFHPADYSLINHRITAPRLGHAFSTHGLTGNLGWALTPVFMTTITLLANWRVAAYSAAGLVAVVLLMTVVWRGLLGGDEPAAQADTPDAKAARAVPKPQDGVLTTLATLLSKPALWGAFLFFACTSIALSSVQNYTIPLLGQLYDLSKVAASSALSGYMVASAVGMAAGGLPGVGQPAHRAHRDGGIDSGGPDAGGAGPGPGAGGAGRPGGGVGRLLLGRGRAVARHADPQGHAQGLHRVGLRPGVFGHGRGLGAGPAGLRPAAGCRVAPGPVDRRGRGVHGGRLAGAVDCGAGAPGGSCRRTRGVGAHALIAAP